MRDLIAANDGLLRTLAAPLNTPVVASDRLARNTNRKMTASSGRTLLSNELARRVLDLFADEVSLVAGVRAIRPSRIVSKPEIPPTEASLPGASNRTIGPKITAAVPAIQPM